jgi:trans-aconitate methyltransferase
MSLKQHTPRDYSSGAYFEYQKKYAGTMRDSDRVLLGIIGKLLASRPAGSPPAQLLDVGCSSGNLLAHLRNAYPGIELHGTDVFAEVIEKCRANPALAGIGFEVEDIREIRGAAQYDVVVLNAVLHLFDDTEIADVLASVTRAVRPGGSIVAFAFLNPFEQDLYIREVSTEQPAGLRANVHSYKRMTAMLKELGYDEIDFQPFEISLDLPYPPSLADLTTYTIMTPARTRLNFRGSLFQPWCHLRARRRAGTSQP